MLGVVIAQRDRFRDRVARLEAECCEARADARAHKDAANAARCDAQHLVEKVRYARDRESQSSSGASSSTTASYAAQSATSSDAGGSTRARRAPSDLELGDAERRYESALDPFAQFKNSERQRAHAKLSVAEIITLQTTRAFLSNRTQYSVLFVNCRLFFLTFQERAMELSKLSGFLVFLKIRVSPHQNESRGPLRGTRMRDSRTRAAIESGT